MPWKQAVKALEELLPKDIGGYITPYPLKVIQIIDLEKGTFNNI